MPKGKERKPAPDLDERLRQLKKKPAKKPEEPGLIEERLKARAEQPARQQPEKPGLIDELLAESREKDPKRRAEEMKDKLSESTDKLTDKFGYNGLKFLLARGRRAMAALPEGSYERMALAEMVDAHTTNLKQSWMKDIRRHAVLAEFHYPIRFVLKELRDRRAITPEEFHKFTAGKDSQNALNVVADNLETLHEEEGGVMMSIFLADFFTDERADHIVSKLKEHWAPRDVQKLVTKIKERLKKEGVTSS